MTAVTNFWAYLSLGRVQQELVNFAHLASAQFQAEIRNRELALERRKHAQPESGPIDLWQGQVAAMERSVSMVRLNFGEAMLFLQGLANQDLMADTVQPYSILLALVGDD